MNKIIKNVNTKKATGPDKIPPKIIRLSANIIDSRLMNIINNDLSNNSFSNEAKVAKVRPIYRISLKISRGLFLFLNEIFRPTFESAYFRGAF